jgi:predicted hotdog family 3-hydroxylacyl-ACP dehydratase
MTLPSLGALIAHRLPMRLIDSALEVGPDRALAELTVRADNPLFVAGKGLPAYVGLELMAQTIGLIDGMKCYLDGVPAKVGFLLGCRRYTAELNYLREGMRLVISVEMVFNGGEMFMFECQMAGEDGHVIATANLNVYAPRDPRKFFEGGVA